MDRVLPKSPQKTSSDSNSVLEKFAKRYRGDYIGFTRLLKVIPKGDGLPVPFELNPIQLAYHNARTARDVVLKARRVGMTTEAIARDLWTLLTQDNPAVAIVCQSGKDHQGATAVRRILDSFLDTLIDLGLPLKFSKRTTMNLELEGRAGTLDIIEAGASEKAASKTGRAGRITRLHCTEMAFWEYGGETMAALRHCVAAPEMGTEIQIESTANGSGGTDRTKPKEATGAALFHWNVQDARIGIGGYRLHFFPWFQDPDSRRKLAPGEVVEPHTDRERMLVAKGIDPEQLKWYQDQLAETKSQDLVDQELASDADTCFLLTGREYFDSETTTRLLANAKSPDRVIPVRDSGAQGEIRIWGLPEKGRPYLIAADTSEGGGGDDCAATVREVDTGAEVAKVVGQIKPGEFGALLVRLAVTYNNALLVVERNGPGLTTLDRALNVIKYRRVFHDRDEKPGWHTNPASRPAALAGLEQAQREGTWRTLDRQTLEQMRVFVWREMPSGAMKAEAARGQKDDLIMAEAIGWDVLRRPVKRFVRDDDVLGGI